MLDTLNGRPETESGPNWISDAARQAVKELAEFLATGVGFLRGPGAFADEWYSGIRSAMNPLGCLATAVAIIVPLEELLAQVFPDDGVKETLLVQILNALGPYVHYAALGAIAHLLLRNRTAPRSLRGSVGVALYAGTIPGVGGSLLAAASLAVFFEHHPGWTSENVSSPSVLVPVLLAFATFAWAASAGLAGLHRVPWWRAALALAAGFVATGLLFPLLPKGHYGLHFEMTIHGLRGLHLGILYS